MKSEKGKRRSNLRALLACCAFTVIVALVATTFAPTSLFATSRRFFWAQAISDMVKLGPGTSYRGAASINLSAARGECVAAQLVAPPPVMDLTATASPLVYGNRASKGAQSRDSAKITPMLYREAFLNIDQASNIEGRTGKWPDPLIPVRDFYRNEDRRAFPVSSRGPEPAVVYYEICVPVLAAPGHYSAEIILEAKHRSKLRFNVSLYVRKFAIPATSSLPNSFGFSGIAAAKGHKLEPIATNTRDLTRIYATAALKHRISLHGMTMDPPPLALDGSQLLTEAYDAEVGPFMDGTVLPDGARFTSTDIRTHPQAYTDAQKIAYWSAFAAHLRKRGWFSRSFLYALDEPKPEEMPLARHIAELAHQADPELKVLTTAPLNPTLEGKIDIFAPNINCLFQKPAGKYCNSIVPLDGYRDIRKGGTRLWWYQSCGSHGCGPISRYDFAQLSYFSKWPSYMIDHDSALNRAMGALAYRFGIEGELYFNTIEAYVPDKADEKADKGSSKKPFEGNPRDIWKNVWRYHGNGDGTLFYPGTPDKIGGTTHIPIESLRLKQIRNGLQDYEYLVLARALGLADQAADMARAVANQPANIARNPEIWARERESLAAKIEAAMSKKEENILPTSSVKARQAK